MKKRRRKRKKQKTQAGGVAEDYGRRDRLVSQLRVLPEGAGGSRDVRGRTGTKQGKRKMVASN